MRTTRRIVAIAAVLAAPALALAGEPVRAQDAAAAPCTKHCDCQGKAAKDHAPREVPEWVKQIWTGP